MKSLQPVLILIAVTFCLYANTLTHGFVLDDEVVLVKNELVHQGVSAIPAILLSDSFSGHSRTSDSQSIVAGGRYRPFSLMVFAAMFDIFGLHPLPYHIMSVSLYALLVFVLYHVVHRVLQKASQTKSIALLTASIFAIHPVHTEVVANIKSIDEIWSLLFAFASLFFVMKHVDQKKPVYGILSGCMMLFALLAKEMAASYIILIPMALYVFREKNLQQAIKYSLPVFIAAGMYGILRLVALSGHTGTEQIADPLNQSFLKWDGVQWIAFTFWERVLAIISVLGRYFQLTVMAGPGLTHDYYPFMFHPGAITLSFFIGCGMLILWIAEVLFLGKLNRIERYGMWMYFLPMLLILNIFFPIGTWMAERFLFFSTVGFALALGFGLRNWWNGPVPVWKWIITGAVIILLSGIIVLRNAAWKSNETLLTSARNVSGASVKWQNDFGTLLLDQGLQQEQTMKRDSFMVEAMKHLKIALDHHPTYYDAYLAYGAAAFYAGDISQSVWSYRKAYTMFPEDDKSRIGLSYALKRMGIEQGEQGSKEEALQLLQESNELLPDTATLRLLETYRTDTLR